MILVFKPNTLKEEASRSLWLQGQSGPHGEPTQAI